MSAQLDGRRDGEGVSGRTEGRFEFCGVKEGGLFLSVERFMRYDIMSSGSSPIVAMALVRERASSAV